MSVEWHQKQTHSFDPKTNTSVATDIPNTFIMYAGAFSAVLSRNVVEKYRWYWNVEMTFGGMTECKEAIGRTSASEEDAKVEAHRVFTLWIYNLSVYAPAALNILRSK